MANYNGPQAFREAIRIVGANETVDVPLAELNAAGTALTLNSAAVATTIAGAVTLSGAVTMSGAVAMSGVLTNTSGKIDKVTSTSASTLTLTSADSGSTVICTKTSATQTFTLPSAATAGLRFTFVTTSAASEVLVNPVTAQTIQIKATVDQGASVVTAAGTGIKNTAATNVVGDSIMLISDGGTAWISIAQSGIWASQ